MKQFMDYSRERMTFEEQKALGLHNPGEVLVVDNKRFLIGTGYEDNIEVFEQKGFLYVVSHNRKLGYASLSVHNLNDPPEAHGMVPTFDEVFVANWEQEYPGEITPWDAGAEEMTVIVGLLDEHTN